jgi:hypothetical protein
MKHYLTTTGFYKTIWVIVTLFCTYSASTTAQSDSTRHALEIFNSAVHVTEQNNAVFPVIMRCGFESEYKTLKDSLLSQMTTHGMSVDEAVGRYIYWFFRNFDRHTQCSTNFFGQLMPTGLVNYEEVIPQYNPQPVGCKVDDDTYLLRLPSCGGDSPTMEWLQNKKAEFLQSGCKYLILDVRGNVGGSDEYSLLFTEMMCDCAAMHDEQVMYLNSAENNKMLTKMYEENPDSTIRRVMEEAASTPAGTLINWNTTLQGTDPYTPLVRKGAIIIDNFCASAGESPIRMVRNYSKSHAIVYGREGTMGADKSGNCNFIQLPNSDITIVYPMCVDMELEKTCKLKSPGHKPDVIIPLPYPKQLTDNIDEWVLWVAKEMKK